jgi:hypothetical protein
MGVESFKDARRLSAITCKEASSVPPKDSSTVNEAVDYPQNIILAQTLEEKLKYEIICRRMAKCASGLVGAERIPALGMWPADIRDDDWWYSLRLLQMLIELSLLGGDIHGSSQSG